ncbi:replication protein [Pseudomonas sp. BN102]|uniref:replication protein n=1 Tax=Pseudomonas sp. BN102 TaxID=2567886 RepID=UPI0024565F4C|nr:replication protein [Pseudomonas sp. BN102]MDH4610333.1 response regulator transcription factor [Pseudomonas sp. BN102]
MDHQLSLLGPQEEAELFHDQQRSGFFALLVQLPDKKRQSSYRLTDMPAVLEMVDPTRDTWISQAEFFRRNRRVVNLARIGLLFVDLDTYRQPWAQGRTPEQQASDALYHCHAEGIPAPSLMVFSGRGLQAKWLLDGCLPRAALPRWNACQRHLVSRLDVLGADPAAMDASRVLRLVNTVNSRSGEICRVVHVENGLDGHPVRYSFEYMAEMLLPTARWDIEATKHAQFNRRQLKLLAGHKTGDLRTFNARQLAWDRLEDLRTLAELRGGVNEGERMQHLFWQLNFLLLSGAVHSAEMYHEAAALACQLDPQWTYRSAELMTLYAKAKAYNAGEKVEFGGRMHVPLYTPKNDTLIDLLQITSCEQKHFRTIISREVARERHRAREETRRRDAGSIDRETYLGIAGAKRSTARALSAQGFSVRAIAERIGISIGSVSNYLNH